MKHPYLQRHERFAAFGLGLALALICLAAGVAIGAVWTLPDPKTVGSGTVAPRVLP
jgi:hypothetical protein